MNTEINECHVERPFCACSATNLPLRVRPTCLLPHNKTYVVKLLLCENYRLLGCDILVDRHQRSEEFTVYIFRVELWRWRQQVPTTQRYL
jgi:hypothetical protein